MKLFLQRGLVERIGMDGSVINHTKTGCDKIVMEVPMKDHKDAIAQVLAAVQDKGHGVVKNMDEIGAVGHRVVHAGEMYAESVLITESVIQALEDCIELAPLHNPPNLLGIAACKELMPKDSDGSGILIQLSIRQCHHSHTYMLFHMILMRVYV